MKHLSQSLFALTVIALIPSGFARAEGLGGPLAKERFQVRLRAIDVIPDEKASLNIPGSLSVGNDVVPEVDLSYFLTEHIAAELIAATSKHKLDYNGPTYLGDAWVLPPTLTLQYHFTPHQAFSPYLGAGINYAVMYNEKAGPGFTNLKIDNSVGPALQAGFDYWIDNHWGLNMDVKKIWMNVDAKLNNNTIRADVDLDPWVVGTGVSYRF